LQGTDYAMCRGAWTAGIQSSTVVVKHKGERADMNVARLHAQFVFAGWAVWWGGIV